MPEKTDDKNEEMTPMIYAAIAGVMSDISHVSKDKINKQQGFKFRSIDDVYNALHPALSAHKVFIVPMILEQTREDAGTTKNGAKITRVICKIKYKFYAEDGSHIETILYGEALDTADKAINKAMAIAYKYACFQVFCIPTEEMIDPDSETHEVNDNSKTEKRESKTVKQNKQEDISEKIEKISDVMINTLHSQMDRTGIEEKTILSMFKVKKIEELDINQFKKAMKKFEVTPDKEESNE